MTSTSLLRTSVPVRRFRVLVVGARNVYRSQAAEELLRTRMGVVGAAAGSPDADGVHVTSVGTQAGRGGAEVPSQLVELLAAEGAQVEGRTTHRLVADAIEEADLVLTASRAERSAVVGQVPSALRRTYTLRELARIARFVGPDGLPDGSPSERFAALVSTAVQHRGPTAPVAPEDDDVPDPAGLDEAAHAESFALVRAAVDAIAAVAAPGSVPPEPEPDPEPIPLPSATVPPRRRRRGRRVALTVGASLVSIVLVAVVGALVVLDRLDRRIERFADPFAALPTRPAAAAPAAGSGQPVTILVLGSTDAVAEGPSGWAQAAERTDVVLLAHVSGDRADAQVVSLSPDLWVDVPGHGDGPLRSALAQGGTPLAVQTVEQLTDVRVDHVALTDAATFARVTTALGGVDLDLTGSGAELVTGQQAFSWVGAAGDDDAERLEREEDWFRAILDRLGDDDVRQSPSRWLGLLGVTSESVVVDEGFDRASMMGLLTSMRALRPGDVQLVSVPTTAGTDPAGTPVLVPDPAPFGRLMDALRQDTLHDYLAGDAG